MQKLGDQLLAHARGPQSHRPSYAALRDALGGLLDAYAEIDELLDLFMADAEPTAVEKRDQRRSNRARDRVHRLWLRAA